MSRPRHSQARPGALRLASALGCCVLLLGTSPATAQGKGQGLEVRAVTPSLLDTTRGRILSLSFRVTNASGAVQELIEAVELPAGWHSITPPGTFVLPAGEQTTRLVALQVPRGTAAGRYELTYRVTAKDDPGLQDFDTVAVAVVAVTKLELLTVDKPSRVFAGEAYELTLRLVNTGNVEVTARLDVQTDPGYRAAITPLDVALPPGQGETLTVSVETDGGLRKPGVNTLRVSARPTGGSADDEARLIVTTDVIPIVTAAPDPYRRLPVEATLRMAGDLDETGVQVEVAGRGELDEDGERQLEFLARGPDIQSAGIWGLHDEYYLKFATPSWRLRLGDQPYGLSRLTSEYRYGRGVGIDLGAEDRGPRFGAYYLSDRYAIPAQSEYAAYLGYALDRDYQVQGNFVQRSRAADLNTPAYDDTLWSLELQARPASFFNLEAEYAIADSDRVGASSDSAYRVELDGRVGRRGYYRLAKIHAGADYYGYYHDSDWFFVSYDQPLSRHLQAHGSYNQYAYNLERRPELLSAVGETLWQGGLNWDLGDGWYTSLDFDSFHRYDRLTPATFNASERALRFGGGWSGSNLSTRLELRAGRQENRLTDRRTTAWGTTVSATWRPAKDAFFSLNAGFGNAGTEGSRLVSPSNNIGAAIDWTPLPNLDLSFWYNRYNFTGSDRLRTDQFNLDLSYAFPNRHRLGFQVLQNTNQWGPDQTYFLATYTVPFGVPIARKRTGGTVEGRIVDAEAEGQPGLVRAVLRINGATAVSDAEGRFVFQAVPPGEYELYVDRDTIGLDRVLGQPAPVRVQVRDGEVARLDLTAVRSASMSGWLVANPHPSSPSAGGVVQTSSTPGGGEPVAAVVGDPRGDGQSRTPQGVANVLVELSDGTETVRRVSDPRGKFLFEGLRPGSWRLRIYEQGLPQYYFVEVPERDLALVPGQRAELVVPVLPKARAIQFIDQGVVTAEPASKAPQVATARPVPRTGLEPTNAAAGTVETPRPAAPPDPLVATATRTPDAVERAAPQRVATLPAPRSGAGSSAAALPPVAWPELPRSAAVQLAAVPQSPDPALRTAPPPDILWRASVDTADSPVAVAATDTAAGVLITVAWPDAKSWITGPAERGFKLVYPGTHQPAGLAFDLASVPGIDRVRVAQDPLFPDALAIFLDLAAGVEAQLDQTSSVTEVRILCHQPG